jgi:diguanylate cyclase (GGDEF)-like protein
VNRLSDTRRLTLERYIALVVVSGIAAAVAVWAVDGAGARELHLGFWLLAALALLGELAPIQVHGEDGEETFSTSFVFAILLTTGAVPALIVQAAASCIGDALNRKPLSRLCFNVAQLTLSWASVVGIAAALNDLPIRDIAPSVALFATLIGAIAVFFTANSVLVRCAEALALGLQVRTHVLRDFGFRGWVAVILFALGVPVAAATAHGPWLVPLMILPLAAVHRASRQSSQMEQLALHDALTGLPNRLLFEQRATEAIAQSRRTGCAVGVLVLDLDRFKEINDTLGHHCGDNLLREIGPRIGDGLRTGDLLSRFGGDEFAVLLRNLPTAEDAEHTAQRLREALSRPFRVQDVSLDVEASVGVATYPAHGASAEALLRNADAAMYRAKELHSGSEVYDPAEHNRSPRRLSMLSDLKRAIEDGELRLAFQPKVALAGGEVRGVEALARWQHRDRGDISPAEFISLAEHTGLIRPLTFRVLELAVDQAARWRDRGLVLPIAVNISSRNLLDRDLPGTIARLLERRGLDPAALSLEITESVVMADPHRSRVLLAVLHDMGLRLAIDDFGTGYSSLAYLRELKPDQLKIDRSFVQDLSAADGDSVIVQSIADLGRNLGITTVAEGAETEAELEQLRALGCDEVQGYVISHPVSASELEAWLTRWNATERAARATARHALHPAAALDSIPDDLILRAASAATDRR